MKKLIVLLLLSWSSLWALEIPWQKEINSTFDRAQKEHRVVMVMVEGQHCRWCKRMKRQTLSNQRVLQRLKPYLLLKIRREDMAAVRGLPQEVHGVPTIFFMTPKHTILERVVGYFGVEDFLSYLDDVEKKFPLDSVRVTPALHWSHNLEKSFALAKAEGKKVMVMVEDVHCRWCKKMKAGALVDEKVKEKLREYVLLKIDRANQKNMEALAGLRGPIPSFHLFDAKRKSLDTLAGYYDASDFLEYLSELAIEEE